MREKHKGGEVISEELLEILACPVCKKDVELKGKELVCRGCGRRYPIENGIPNMLPDELRYKTRP